MAGIGSQGIHLIVRFLMTPFVIAHVGLAGYGYWSVLFLVLGLLGINRGGMLGAAVSWVARYRQEQRLDRVQSCLSSAASLAALLAAAVGPPLWFAAPTLVAHFGLESEMLPEAVFALRWMVVATLVSLVFSGYQSALEACLLHPRVKLVEGVVQLVEAGLIFWLLATGHGLAGVAIAFVVRALLPIPVYATMLRSALPGIRPWPGLIDRIEAARLLRLGGAVQGVGALQFLAATLDRLAVGKLCSPEILGTFEVARKLVSYACALPTHGLAPLIPASATLDSSSRDSSVESRELLRSATRVLCTAAAAPLAFLVAAGGAVTTAWLGANASPVAPIMAMLAVGVFVHAATGPTTAVYRGMARPRWELTYSLIWLGGVALLVPLFARHFGWGGAAVASTLAQGGASLWLLWCGLPRLGVPRRTLLRDLLGPAACSAAATIPVAALDWILPTPSTRWEAVSFVAPAAAWTLFATLALSWRLVLVERERLFLRRWLDRFRASHNRNPEAVHS